MGLTLSPQNADFHFYRGNLLAGEAKLEQACQSFSKAITLGANYADTHSALGRAQYMLGNKSAAIESFRNAQRIDPDAGALAQYASGYHYLRRGDLANALANFEMAIALRPDLHKAYSMLLFMLSFSPQHSPSYQEIADRYAAMLREQTPISTRTLKNAYARGSRPLRVGFVSGDLKAHPVGFFLEGILQAIDPKRMVSIAYSNTSNEDQNTIRLQSRFSEWHDIRNIGDEAAAQLIRDHQIDVLVDLAGHTGENRLPIFTRQPAPVQVTWLGYFASTGLPEINYILADNVSVPEHSTEFFSEKVWRLPDTRLCMTPPVTNKQIDVSPPPCLSKGYVTFGSFQSRSKINSQVLWVWSQVLTATPGSRLRLQLSQMDISARREELLQELEIAGISRDRVSLNTSVHWAEYLAAYQHVDILLDTFPYPGGTTTAEALWMGVPTVTLIGDTMLSRQGACMLKCVELDDWIAEGEQHFVDKAVAFASDPAALTRLRSELRARAINSPLFDTRRFAANLQDCFEAMFQLSE
jgi:predicted O-linked N-acetylglucosamine transferase (SPINDLY family)